jgi:DNA-directed RNA polymerase subunit RPC12/RpoP
MLRNISPLPHIPVKKTTKKQATILTSSQFIRNKQLKKSKAEREKREMKQGPPNASTNKKKKQRLSLQKTAGNPEVDSHSCAECWENYYTTSKDDWIRCVKCSRWLHENCTVYADKCTDCGRQAVTETNFKKQQ